MRALWTSSILILAAAACRGPEAAPPDDATEPAGTAHAAKLEVQAAVAVTALEEAVVALAAWRGEVEAGERLDDGQVLRLRGVTQRLGRELQALMDEVEARDAALRPDPDVEARRQFLTLQALEIARPWIDDLHAPDERHDEALGQVREALEGQDEVRQLAALLALQEVGDLHTEDPTYRALVVPIAREATGLVLVAALEALQATAPRPADLEFVHAAWERDPEGLGYETLRLLRTFDEGHLRGRSEQIALACLSDVDGRRANLQLHGLWGARVGPELEARVLELARSSDPQIRHAALYFGLATFEDKSGAVVDALIEALADPDPNRSDRALWGLGRGVPRESQSRVAAALVELHNDHSDPQVRARCAELVERYGGAKDVERLHR